MSEMTSQFKKSVNADYEDKMLNKTFPFFSNFHVLLNTNVKNHSEAVTLDTNEDASLENRYLDEMGGGGV